MTTEELMEGNELIRKYMGHIVEGAEYHNYSIDLYDALDKIKTEEDVTYIDVFITKRGAQCRIRTLPNNEAIVIQVGDTPNLAIWKAIVNYLKVKNDTR